MNEIELHLPPTLHFKRPDDYAMYCGGRIVRVTKVDAAEQRMRVRWDDAVIQFVYGSHLVEYSRKYTLGLGRHLHEEMMQMVICTLRIVFRGEDGETGSLLILSGPESAGNQLTAVTKQIEACRLPIPICWD